ncbi:MAG: chromosome segregation and condensation protein, ScpB [Firmicutes bacterium]|nr:chromosome segregation and condensation protein, ScpB [Bacillota bacterium]
MKEINANQIEFEETSNRNRLYSVIESLLFVSGEPVGLSEISRIIDCSLEFTRTILGEMLEKYRDADRGIRIICHEGCYSLATKPENSLFVEELLGLNARQSLSQAAMETLAIVAYRQPVTRVVIDDIRGVKSERAIASLLEKGIIKECGRLEAPGRPILYSTSEEFLKYFGLESLNELPGIDSFAEEL